MNGSKCQKEARIENERIVFLDASKPKSTVY